MNERLYELRKMLKMSQEKFGAAIGITGAAVSRLESGERALTESSIKLICSTFYVSEEWLRAGEGTIFINPDAAFANFLGTLFRKENAFKKRAIVMLSRLSDEQWEMLREFVYELAGKELED